MDNRLFYLLCDIEDYLVSMIDSDPDYVNYEDMEAYINSKDPEIAGLYHCFQKLADRFIGKEE